MSKSYFQLFYAKKLVMNQIQHTFFLINIQITAFN